MFHSRSRYFRHSSVSFPLSAVLIFAGTPAEAEDTLRIAELRGVRAMIETYPIEKAAEAYARMMSGKAQFRVVLTM
jgi:D-arabinose 1-dehydrogenase-like Zn-dependent alcohol dehydrogenase